MDTIKNAANYVSDKTSEAVNSASKETNKQVAKDSNVGIGDRASAAKDYVGDSLDQVRCCFYILLSPIGINICAAKGQGFGRGQQAEDYPLSGVSLST